MRACAHEKKKNNNMNKRRPNEQNPNDKKMMRNLKISKERRKEV